MKKPAKAIGLTELHAAMAALPNEVLKWTRAAHRAAWIAYRDRMAFPGLAHRLAAVPADQAMAQVVIGRPMNPYGFSARRRQISWNSGRLRPVRGATPAYVSSGKARDELLKRRANPRLRGTAVVTTATIHFRALPLIASKHGVADVATYTKTLRYMMTMYKDTIHMAGQYRRMVTRQIKVPVYTKSAKTFGEEWSLRPAEVAWMASEIERLLNDRVRNSVWDKRGRIRKRFAGVLASGEGEAA